MLLQIDMSGYVCQGIFLIEKRMWKDTLGMILLLPHKIVTVLHLEKHTSLLTVVSRIFPRVQ